MRREVFLVRKEKYIPREILFMMKRKDIKARIQLKSESRTKN
jgi:hypothetical protein